MIYMKKLFLAICITNLLFSFSSCAGDGLISNIMDTKEEEEISSEAATKEEIEISSETAKKNRSTIISDGYDSEEAVAEAFYTYFLCGSDGENWCRLIPDDIEEALREEYDMTEEDFYKSLETTQTKENISDFTVNSTRVFTEDERDGADYNIIQAYSLDDLLRKHGIKSASFCIEYVSFNSSDKGLKDSTTCISFMYKDKWYSYSALMQTANLLDAKKAIKENKEAILQAGF